MNILTSINRIMCMVIALLSLYACEKNTYVEVPKVIHTKGIKPELSNLEVGIQNSMLGYPGEDLHVDAAFVAINEAASVYIYLTPVTLDNIADETKARIYAYDFSKNFKSQKSGQLHIHFNLPEKMLYGTYELAIEVVDKEGNKGRIASPLTVRLDPNLPIIEGYKRLWDNEKGELTIVGKVVNASAGIKNFYLEVTMPAVSNSKYVFTDAIGKTSYDLNNHVINFEKQGWIKGHYHAHIILEDNNGLVKSYNVEHFDWR